MISFTGALKIYLALEPCDMRNYAELRISARASTVSTGWRSPNWGRTRRAGRCSFSATNATTGSRPSTSTEPECGFRRNGSRWEDIAGRSRRSAARPSCAWRPRRCSSCSTGWTCGARGCVRGTSGKKNPLELIFQLTSPPAYFTRSLVCRRGQRNCAGSSKRPWS